MIELIGGDDGSGQSSRGSTTSSASPRSARTIARRVTKLKNDLDSQQQDLAAQQQSANDAAPPRPTRRTRSTRSPRSSTRPATPRPTPSRRSPTRSTRPSPQHAEAEAALAGGVRSFAAARQRGGRRSRARRRHVHPAGLGCDHQPVRLPHRPDHRREAFHSGIDFGASCGTPIKAAGNGVSSPPGRRPAATATT